MKLSDMKQLLVANDLRLTKSLGQNFLHDQNQLRRIIETAELSKQDSVLEIGPGLGPLTELLLAQAHTVLAIEKDERLVRLLQERFKAAASKFGPPCTQPPAAGSPSLPLQLVHGDALDFPRSHPRDWSEWKLVANLPYSVASPILVELAQSQHGPRRMVVTLQIEVARRLTAEPRSLDYGVLTLLMQLDYEPRGWFKIPASCFFPQPEIDSACVCLVRRQKRLLSTTLRPVFVGIVKRSFSQRRKMVLKLLKADWPGPALEKALAELQLPLQARAETLSLQEFVRLTQLLAPDSQS